MPLYYAAADALLLTSESEGSPNSVKEALACELPVVSVEVGDVRERIEGAPSCAVVARDPDAIARAVERALDNPRPGGLRAHVQELSIDVIARRIIEVYREALSIA
jgi:glycosyltransferase involved in cell wall biosynthesis